jgi:anti-sigma regulatory factor (Ser/Thr protein kinase)
MRSDVGLGTGGGFRHQALLYDSDREFMEVALPFVEDGLSAGQPTLVAVQDRHVENLRAALGGTPDRVTLYPVEEWYETSARTRQKFATWAAEQTERGGRARLMGEPPWAVGQEAQVRDWARHESVINVAFAGQPVTFICPYEAGALPEDVLAHARCTHPEIVSADGVAASTSYENPLDFCRGLDCGADTRRNRPDLELEFDLEALAAVRRAIGSFAIDAGLSGSRMEEIVLAVNEITTNAVIHGRPPAAVRAWRTENEIVVEVTDAGDGIRDALAGQLMPPTASGGGRGIWLARLLFDAVEVRNGTGCTVTMHAATPSDRAATPA